MLAYWCSFAVYRVATSPACARLPLLGCLAGARADGGSSSHGIAAAAASEANARFQRAARTVGDCLTLVKGLSPEVNSARSFREKCSNLLGAAIASTLALQEVRCSGNCSSRAAAIAGATN